MASLGLIHPLGRCRYRYRDKISIPSRTKLVYIIKSDYPREKGRGICCVQPGRGREERSILEGWDGDGEKVGRLRHPSRRGRTTSRYPNNNNTHSPLCGIVVGISSLSAERELLLIFRGPTPTIAATLVRPGSRIARRAPLPESLVPRVFMTPDP